MRSRRIAAKQALDWGIATEVAPDTELEAATDALVRELVGFPAPGAANRQEAAQRHRGFDSFHRHRAGRPLLQPVPHLGGFSEGVAAFLEKRDLSFTGW